MAKPRKPIGIGGVLLVLLGTVDLVAQEHDLWFLLTQDGQCFGSNLMQVSRTSEGQQYVIETRIPMSFLGQSQEILLSGEYRTTAELRPISARGQMSMMSGTVATTEATLEGNTLEFTSVSDGEESSATLAIDSSLPVIFDVSVGEWLARQPAGTDQVQLQLVELQEGSSWQLSKVTLSRQPTEEIPRRWRMETEDPAQSAILVLGEDGFELERTFEAAAIYVERCSKEEASKVKPIVEHSGRDVLFFKLDRPISDPELLTDLTVELSWKDIPFEEFELEDSRQSLVEKSEEDGNYRAVVNIHSPARLDSEVSIPCTGAEFEPFLAETEYIQPHHAAIRETASRVVEGKSSALAAARALCAWVYDYVEGALIVETLTGPQVLERKTGKCTEYSTLFASLARSVGIPTRIAFGERMVKGHWGGHIWNEVYVGDWIPVDASVNEVGESFELLKFLHSDTINGTQPLRMGLVDSLMLSIQDFELDQSSAVELLETGLEGNTYTSIERGFRFRVKPSGWDLVDASAEGIATIHLKVPDAEGVVMALVAFDLTPGMTAVSFANARAEMFRPSYDDFEVLASESTNVAGVSGHTISFSGFPEGSEEEGSVTEFVWTHETSCFLLTLIASTTDHDEFLPDFEDLLKGFEFFSGR
jgi:hypothetical protein